MGLNVADIHPFIVERSWKILRRIRLEDIQKASPGAATFYVWVGGIHLSHSSLIRLRVGIRGGIGEGGDGEWGAEESGGNDGGRWEGELEEKEELDDETKVEEEGRRMDDEVQKV